MKNKLILALGALALTTTLPRVAAQGTAFTYQGHLNDGASPANGNYDLAFSLFDATNGLVKVTSTVTNSTTISNGLFTVALDFGPNFSGPDRWLEIGARKSGGGSFIVLAPRQQITPTPYAITAENLASVSQFNVLPPGLHSTIGGGTANTVSNSYATIGGGYNNTNSGYDGTIGGGAYNTVNNGYATVAGGAGNTASGGYATVGGGASSTASGPESTVSGGNQNVASGIDSTVPGGGINVASGDFSFAAGYNAHAMHSGAFVWNDGSGESFSSTVANQFSVRATGGIRLAGDVAIEGGASTYHHLQMSGGNSLGFLYGSFPLLGDGIHLGYNWYADNGGVGHVINAGGATSRITAGYGEILLAVGGVNVPPYNVRLRANTSGVSVYGTFNNNSDRNAKQDFTPVSPSQILDEVLQLPLCEWSYKVDASTRHLGPMAQDFYSTFNIGTDDKHIAPIDEGGVALAAIQGLNQKVEALAVELKRRDTENAELQQRLKSLENITHNQQPN